MIIHNLDERRIIKTPFRNPRGQLAVPHKRMAMHLLLLLHCIVSHRVRTVERKYSPRWLSGLPFHGIFRGDGAEVRVVVYDGAFGSVDRVADGEGGAEKGAASGDDGCVKTYGWSTLFGFLDAGDVRMRN